MTIIPDRFDKIGIVLREMQSNMRNMTTFSTNEVYSLYVQRYPGDIQIMEGRKLVKPKAHNLEGYLNGEIYIYSQQTDGRDLDRPAIEFLEKGTYRFVSPLDNENSFSDEDGPISQRESGDYQPNQDDFESAYRMLCSPGKSFEADLVLDQIEKNATESGYHLKENWRVITKRNIKLWTKK